VCCGADYGMAEISMALPTDAPMPSSTQRALYHQGRTEYERKGYPLTHGIDGFGLFGYPLPWGESAAMDYFLSQHGHAAG
jgi:hypothetical protein